MPDRLQAYRAKRDFGRTTEPSGHQDPPSDDAPRFVIQHHAASSEHYDLRLEVDGVLVSWAVPKGPSTDPRERRLAVRTEDHPLDYIHFEGTIPDDEYGGGSVIVWDAGTYELRGTSSDDDDTADGGSPLAAADALEAGHLSVELDGHKLQGGYTLHRIRDDKDQWLLVKQHDDDADARRRPTSTEPESVISARTVHELAERRRSVEDLA